MDDLGWNLVEPFAYERLEADPASLENLRMKKVLIPRLRFVLCDNCGQRIVRHYFEYLTKATFLSPFKLRRFCATCYSKYRWKQVTPSLLTGGQHSDVITAPVDPNYPKGAA